MQYYLSEVANPRRKAILFSLMTPTSYANQLNCMLARLLTLNSTLNIRGLQSLTCISNEKNFSSTTCWEKHLAQTKINDSWNTSIASPYVAPLGFRPWRLICPNTQGTPFHCWHDTQALRTWQSIANTIKELTKCAIL